MNNQRIDKIYNYEDLSGKLVFQVIRFDPKGFSQRRPFENGFVWGLVEGWYQKNNQTDQYHKINTASMDKATPPNPDAVWFETVEPILYHLPNLIYGIENGKTVFICEGEKDAENLATLDFITTTCPMGAGKWRKTFTEILRYCFEAIVITDKDIPGRAHAQTVAYELYSAGAPVKIIEMPDIDGTPIKDISDWLTAGGTREDFLNLLKECPNWVPPDDFKPPIVPELQSLIDQYGEPYYLNKDGGVAAINQAFWASLHQTENIQLFEPDERAFYRYNPETGLYSIVSEDIIKQEIAGRILDVSRQQELPSLEHKRTNSNLNHIVAQLKGISEKKNVFRRDNNTFVHLANGVIVFKNYNDADFCSFSPKFYSRNQCPIPFNASATCERFLNELLYPAVTADDAILLQKYTGLCLLGNNLIQKLLILDGKPGRGKSTLALIIQNLIGQVNVTELRTKHLSDRFELFRYLKKNLLVGVDVPGQFLSEKGAYYIKGLVGGDWFDAEQKCGTGSFPFQGNFCILITSNSRLQVRLDGDTGAWKRRLLIMRFEAPAPTKKIPDFKDILIRKEGSGILNWALRGLGMLLSDIESHGDIQLTKTQENIIDGLLAESDSLRHFLIENVVENENANLTTTEIIEAYAEYCPTKGWNPKPVTIIHREMESLMLELFKTTKSNSIERNGKSTRGFRRVTFKNEGKQPWD